MLPAARYLLLGATSRGGGLPPSWAKATCTVQKVLAGTMKTIPESRIFGMAGIQSSGFHSSTVGMSNGSESPNGVPRYLTPPYNYGVR